MIEGLDRATLAAVAAVQVAEGRDDEGEVVFQVRLCFREGLPVVVSPVWRHGREGAEAVARALAAAAGVGTVNVRARWATTRRPGRQAREHPAAGRPRSPRLGACASGWGAH